MPTILNTLGEHIKKRRLELRLHQAQVAEILGVYESTVTNWEKSRTKPMLHLLPKILAFLGYDPMAYDFSTVGGRLIQYRKSRGMTQKELAKLIGIDPTTLGRLERNQGNCLRSVVKKLPVFLRNSTVQDEE